jgi:hypothetical protein
MVSSLPGETSTAGAEECSPLGSVAAGFAAGLVPAGLALVAGALTVAVFACSVMELVLRPGLFPAKTSVAGLYP